MVCRCKILLRKYLTHPSNSTKQQQPQQQQHHCCHGCLPFVVLLLAQHPAQQLLARLDGGSGGSRKNNDETNERIGGRTHCMQMIARPDSSASMEDSARLCAQPHLGLPFLRCGNLNIFDCLFGGEFLRRFLFCTFFKSALMHCLFRGEFLPLPLLLWLQLSITRLPSRR